VSRTTKTRNRKTATTKPPQRAVLPVRPTPAPEPDFITDSQIRAHYEARLADLPHTPITAWTPLPDGTHAVRFPSGARLTHTPGTPVFTAHTPCPQGAHHQAVVTNGRQLENAERTAAACTNPHGQARILTLAAAAATTEDTAPLDVTEVRATTEQPKGHPQP
jgi:hypothetical protein